MALPPLTDEEKSRGLRLLLAYAREGMERERAECDADLNLPESEYDTAVSSRVLVRRIIAEIEGMPPVQTCHAVQHGDLTACEVCGLCWDTNDAHPPGCKATS